MSSENPEAQSCCETFTVKDADSANWVIRKIAEARAYAERAKRWADAEVRRARRAEEFFVARFGEQLRRWTIAELASRHSSSKSISMPAGRIGFRTQPVRVEVVDSEAAIAWCKQNLPSAVEARESLAKSVVTERALKTGELPPGCKLAGGDERFFIGQSAEHKTDDQR
jgi:hypothetical protein